jgi:hypothetical protein
MHPILVFFFWVFSIVCVLMMMVMVNGKITQPTIDQWMKKS